ncbi:MAG: response regulator transcription factor [Chloroflexi bacterium]|nr:response regulator transcription factor [Chloroflexota bacterium]
MKVLIAEDDLATRKMLRFIFEQQGGHAVAEADTARLALEMLIAEQVDLLVADLILPDLDGFDLIRRVRRTSNVPIMVVSARAHLPDRVRGLKCGADDFLAKPFDVAELLARADAILRRSVRVPRVERDDQLKVGGLLLDKPNQVVELNGRLRVQLTPTEFRLLLHLAKTPGEVRTRRELEQAVAGDPHGVSESALNTYISNLRQKLESDPARPRLIQTVRSRGYRLAV